MPDAIEMIVTLPIGDSEIRQELNIEVSIEKKLSNETILKLEKLIASYVEYHCGFTGIEEVDFQKARCRKQHPKTEGVIKRIEKLSEEIGTKIKEMEAVYKN